MSDKFYEIVMETIKKTKRKNFTKLSMKGSAQGKSSMSLFRRQEK